MCFVMILSMNEHPKGSSSEGWRPEPPESFAIEFLNGDHTRAMSEMGFRFTHSRAEGENNVVVFEGERANGDGTKIEIRITKGGNYKSPKELMGEE